MNPRALLAPALLLVAASPALADPGQWKVEDKSRFGFVWSFSENRTEKTELGETVTAETREVVAKLANGVGGTTGRLEMVITHVSWTVKNPNITAEVTWNGGSSKPKTKYEAGMPANEATAKARASGLALAIRKKVRLAFKPGYTTIETEVAPGSWTDTALTNGNLFSDCYLQTALPEGELSNGQSWKEEIKAWGRIPFYGSPTKGVQYPQVEYKLKIKGKEDALTLSVKGSGKSSFKGTDMGTYGGKSLIKRQFAYGVDYLKSGKEEVVSTIRRMTNAPMTGTFTRKQSLKIKKVR